MNRKNWLQKFSHIQKRRVSRYGHYVIFLVNGPQVRKSSLSAEEFTNFAIHDDFPNLIPKNEIWISNEVSGEERYFAIHDALYQLKCIQRGMSKSEAYERAILNEKSMRQSKLLSRHSPESTNKPAPESVYIKRYCQLGDISVWIVDGSKIRDLFKTDFVDGGHGYVYPWIPNDEVWIESGLDDREIKYTLYHEVSERNLMKNNHMEYHQAHSKASKLEFECRNKSGCPKPENCNV
jgi:hypothetical protein